MRKVKEQTAAAYFANRPAEIPFQNEIVCGDSAELLKLIPDDSVDLVITSPPYFQQREYDGGGVGNEKQPDEYISALMGIFRECVRVIKPTGSVVFNVGDKYEDGSLLLMPYRFAIAAPEQCGVTLVNHVTWVKSNPTPRQFKRRLVRHGAVFPFCKIARLQILSRRVSETRRRAKGKRQWNGRECRQKIFLAYRTICARAQAKRNGKKRAEKSH